MALYANSSLYLVCKLIYKGSFKYMYQVTTNYQIRIFRPQTLGGPFSAVSKPIFAISLFVTGSDFCVTGLMLD